MENLTLQSDLEVVEPSAVCRDCGAPCTDEDASDMPDDNGKAVYRCGACVVRRATAMMG